MTKRGQTFHYIIAGVLALVLIVAMIMIIRNNLGKEEEITSGQIDDTQDDKDCDGVPNVIDRCCDTASGIESVDMWGCATDEHDAKTPCSKVEGRGEC